MPETPRSVLIVTRTFPPDPAAVGQLVSELAIELVARGWRVGIATTTANPAGREPVAGVEIKRVAPWFPFTRASTARRALSYLSIFPALLRATRALPGNWDFIVTTSDPPLQVLLGPVLRLAMKGRVVQWSQDLYPEIAEELDVLSRGGPLAGFFRSLSNWGLRQSDLIIVPGRCMAERLRARGLPDGSIRVVPNWSAPVGTTPGGNAPGSFRRGHGIGDAQFVVTYSGNFGLAHSFEAILQAAAQLKDTRPEIVFLMIGDGPRLAEVRAESSRRALTNMQFLPLQPRERLAESLGAADVHLVTMREPLAGLVVPSKFYGVLAAGRPAIFIGPANSEVALAIRENGCGVVVGESETDALIEAITRYADDPNVREQAGKKARDLSADFSAASSADKFLAALQMTRPGPGEAV